MRLSQRNLNSKRSASQSGADLSLTILRIVTSHKMSHGRGYFNWLVVALQDSYTAHRSPGLPAIIAVLPGKAACKPPVNISALTQDSDEVLGTPKP